VEKFDFVYWTKKYAEDYPTDVEGRFPIYVDEQGREHEERSPYFETISKVLQRRGHLLKQEFVSIGMWKTERQTKRYRNNSDEDVESITKEAIAASDKDKVRILLDLEGVGVPVASSVLTMTSPREYCIIDYRAVRALLWLKKMEGNRCITFVSYGEYSDFLDSCGAYGTVRAYYDFRNDMKNIGTQKHMTPRQVEMALWKFDEMKGEQ
jgi:hypothetical protein